MKHSKAFFTWQSKGIKPIIGAELWVGSASNIEANNRLVFLCRNETGYRQLSELITRSFLEGQSRGIPAISYDWLTREGASGLIALSGGINGDIGAALIEGNADRAMQLLDYWRERLGDAFYLELSRTGRPGEDIVNEGNLALAQQHSAPVVATNDVRFFQ